MKSLLLILLIIPATLFAQQIECSDTITINGYFYRIKDNRLSAKAFTNDDKHFYFATEADVNSKSLFNIIRERDKQERDTVKFLSYKPTKDLSLYANVSCQDKINKIISIKPFSTEIKLYKIKGDKWREVQVSYVRVKWLHLKMKKDVACGEGFDRPATLYCDLSKDRFFDIYVPLELLEINHKVQLKNNGLVVHSLLY